MIEEPKEQENQNNNVGEFEQLKYKSFKSVVLASINGLLIGLAIILPGVSGSTISMIFKLYDKIIFALANIFKKFVISILFLLPILLGAAIGFIAGFFTIQQLIDKYTFICVAIFAGMMLGGAKEVHDEIVTKNIRDHKIIDWILLAIGIILPIALSVVFVFTSDLSGLEGALEGEFPIYIYFVMLGLGVLVSLTQVIPGLSATALLMSFGVFSPIMESVHISTWQAQPLWLVIYLMLVIGFVAGILLLSKIINYFLKKYRFRMFHLLTGMTYGSIIAIFYNVETVSVYNNWAAGGGSMVLDLSVGIPLFFVGFAISFCILYFGNKYRNKSEKAK